MKSKKINIKKLEKKVGRFFSKAIPLWMVVMLLVQSTAAVGLLEYYVMKRYVQEQIIAIAKAKSPEELAQILQQEVTPQDGYTLAATWGDTGKELLDSGVIDQQKYNQLFTQDPGGTAMMKYLNNTSQDHMTVNTMNARFMVNTLWAIGLVNKSKILDNGQMQQYGQGDPMQYASTGGWDLGSKTTKELYSSQPIIQLTDQQQTLVKKIADTVFRPCCNNPTSFPDCNHGMAALGYIELAVKQGVSEKRIYQDVLALNSYWFPQQYVTLATYYQKQNIDWHDVDAKVSLSQQYSSSQGSGQIQQQVQPVSAGNGQGGGCSA